MKKILFFLSAFLLFLGTVGSAQADPIVVGGECENTSNECVRGINGLEVQGMVLNVTFMLGAYDEIYAASTPFFLGNEEGANAAAEAIVDLLDGSYWGVIGDGEETRIDGLDDLIFINTELLLTGNPSTSNTFGAVLTNVQGGTEWGIRYAPSQQLSPPYYNTSLHAPSHYTAWAVFENASASVPEPAIILLLGTGLAGLAGFRRKFKKS